jgi:two-component system response regulator YesN
MNKNKVCICDLAMELILSQKAEELGKLTVSEIARQLDVSPSYLSRLFKKERIFTLQEYLVRAKLMRSASLLIIEPSLKIRRLAKLMGFVDTEYFASLFKKNFGISPAKYRECRKRK